MKSVIIRMFVFVSLTLLLIQPTQGSSSGTNPLFIPAADTILLSKAQAPGPYQTLALSLIELYQKHSSERSLHRCPFYTSCSNFASRSIVEYGLLSGTTRFFDRYYFRENFASSQNYPFKTKDDGVLKLDDDFFLESEMSQPLYLCYAQDSIPRPSHHPTRLDWADCLFAEGDYSRAITIYKEVYFFSEIDSVKKVCQYQVARCNLALRDFHEVAIGVGNYLSNENITERQQSRAHILLGLNYAAQKLFPMAEMEFYQSVSITNSDNANLFLSWITAERGNYKEACIQFEFLADHFDDESAKIVKSWTKRMSAIEGIKRKNPHISTLLSTVIPGSGQIYCGHTVDALQAFVMVTTFSLATWMAYRYELSNNKARVGTAALASITLTFHAANIWGAQRTAKYRNHRLKQDLLYPLRDKIATFEFNLPAP
ncbi:MAG: membrane protein insertion efficiency factor YidD [Candidatus Hatepunaea meridiana]|nr:membrane protein insertion efficiency factor YidD [Candidatus Hatepunaea meridiana]